MVVVVVLVLGDIDTDGRFTIVCVIVPMCCVFGTFICVYASMQGFVRAFHHFVRFFARKIA